MKTQVIPFALGLCIMTLVHSVALCQIMQRRGTITGKVFDAETREPIVSANVVVLGTKAGAASDTTGTYRIFLAPGTYSLRADYISYDADTVTAIQVQRDSVAHVDIALRYRHADTVYWQTLARADLASGRVRILVAGLRILPIAVSAYDSIVAKYGFQYDSDCGGSSEGFGLYDQIVYSHLDSLNGPGWQERLEADIERARQQGQ